MADKNSGGIGTTIPKALKWIWPPSGAGSHDGAKSSGTPTGQKKKNPTKSKPTKKPSTAQGKASLKKPADTATTPAATDSEAGPGPSSDESQPPNKVSQQGEIDVLGKANAPAAITATDLGKASSPQGPSDKEVSAQAELEKKVDASVSSFVEGQNPADGTEEPLDVIKKDIVASLKELENSEDADPVLLSAADTAASLIAANSPEVDQNSDGTAAASQNNPAVSPEVKEGPIQATTILPDGSTKALQAKKDSNDTPAAPSDKPNESAEAKETQSDAAEAALGKPLSSEEADLSSGKKTDSSANPATPNKDSKDINPAPLHTTAKETIGPGSLDAANKETANAGNSDATTREDGPAGLGPKAQKPPIPKILIEAASDATDDDLSLDIPPIQTVPRAVPSVSAIPSEVIPEIAENVDEPETPKLRKRKLYLRKMRNITLQKPILDAALGRQLASETKRKLQLLAKGEPYGLRSEVPDVADPVDAAPGATDPGDLAEVDANAADPTPSATDATDSPRVAADPVDAAPGATDPADSAEVDANVAGPTPSATDATDSPKVAADPVDAAQGGIDPADSAEVDANAADPALSAAAENTDSSNLAVDPVDAAPGVTGPADLAEGDANAADPAPGAANPTDSSNVAVGPVDAGSGAIGPADPAPIAAADATETSNVAVGPIDSSPDTSDTTGSDAINADAANPAPGAVGAPFLPEVAADTADPAPAAADTSNSVLVPKTTDSAPTAANTSSSTST